MDEELPLSSSPQKRNPEEEVHEIVEQLRTSAYLNPIVVNFLKERRQKDLFYEVIARQANLIKSRSQSFDDGHITVYDKVLLCLTDNGNRFDNAAAQEYFCEEFLGISKDGNPMVAERILRHHVILKAILAQAANPEGQYGDKYSSETKYGQRGQDIGEAEAEGTKKDTIEHKIERLTSVYQKAKSDFEAVPYRDGIAKLNAARFLRDTAENTVMYFRDVTKSGDGHDVSSKMQDLIAELEQTCKMAQASVVTLSGGRKRKFDRHDYEVASRGGKGTDSRGPSKRRGSASHTGDGGDRGRISKRKKGSPRPDRRRNVQPIAQRSGFSREYPLSEHRPFGYTRPVDSYQPGKEEEKGTSHSHPYPQRRYPEGSASPNRGYEGRGRKQREEGMSEDPSLRYGRGFGQEWEEEGRKYYGYEREREREREHGHSYGHGSSGYGGGGGRQERY
ncbi:hypothetical protein EPUS_05583 [Endocarpon pusillum Z07020]|uniref:Uncharacterized protein n=1 Tax=Endocarpon pusillum (strain Z07020 / HMAS-L-300199) TaxID=1263415 RepID=U1GIS7_ENDPU|nr:uncharacterized protein EPUS_05583 [Endocarpon pusillum Z07020]ERF71711.1 hypothetical protein EPUS_05583 [Endocarpon pusillum Z07020]